MSFKVHTKYGVIFQKIRLNFIQLKVLIPHGAFYFDELRKTQQTFTKMFDFIGDVQVFLFRTIDTYCISLNHVLHPFIETFIRKFGVIQVNAFQLNILLPR